MDNYLVSIILPVFNSEEYLERCIESILNQTYINIELIIINDGSSDKSELICKQYSNKDNRIHYFFQENSGPSVARNKGIELAKGEFIQFVDSDDYLEHQSIEILIKNSNDVEFVIAGYKNIYTNNKNSKIKSNKTGLFIKKEFLDFFGETLEKQLFHYTWHKLYRKEIVTKIRFKEEINIGEDLFFNLDYMDYVEKIKIIDNVVYNHIWDNPSSITKKYHANLFLSRKLMHERLILFLQGNKKFYGINKEAVENLYVKRIILCFININKKSPALSIAQRIYEIKLITNDKTVREIISQFINKGFITRVLGKLIEQRRYHFLLCYSLILTFAAKIRS